MTNKKDQKSVDEPKQDEPKQSDEQKQDDPEKVAEKNTEAVQEAVDAEEEKGYRGVEIDTTPNENYTVPGVTSGAPVPEAAKDPAVARREAAADISVVEGR